MSENNNTFHAKVLLFGEYSILLNSNGLTIPYSHFNGSLDFIKENSYTDLDFAHNSNQHLKAYAEYLDKKPSEIIDTKSLLKDISKGLFFESSIPEGYGLGSSGALVAAIYKQYAVNKIVAKAILSNTETQELKNYFAELESFFHGKSSGIDPLICYLNRPLFIEDQLNISSISFSRQNIQSDDAIFIVNTNQVGKTAPLVDLFMQKCLNPTFTKMLKEELIPTTNKCIQALLKGELNPFYKHLRQLSKFQLNHFKEMIPNEFLKVWEHGLNQNDYLLKLCGSGGGGYLLGFTRNYSKVKKTFSAKGLEVIPVYQQF